MIGTIMDMREREREHILHDDYNCFDLASYYI